nr:MAG TPA: hypothetical protein [Caudoviricetes sp.]
MNYSLPVKTKSSKKDNENAKYQVFNIIDQQIIITQLDNGITYQDTENMDDFERTYILDKLIEMKKEELDLKKKAIEKANNN